MRQAMGYLDQAPDKDTRVELIKTLQTVTEGKVSPAWSCRVACFRIWARFGPYAPCAHLPVCFKSILCGTLCMILLLRAHQHVKWS